MDDKVSPEIQDAVEDEAKEEIIKEDVKKDVNVKDEAKEQAKEKEETVEARKETVVATQRRPQQQNEDFQKKRMYFRKKVCRLCSQKATSVDYKNVDLLRRYITDRGKILPRRITGNCARHQRMLARAIKRARMAGLLPFVSK